MYLQLVDPELLRTRLAESLFYLHGQPPLFNLYLGVLLKVFPGHYAFVAHATYSALGLLGALALYGLLVRLGRGVWVSVAVAVLVTVAPTAILYENVLFYEYPVAVLLVLSAFALNGFLREQTFWRGFAFFLSLAALIWIRSTFQILWMLLVAGLVVVALKDRRKLVLRACLVPLLLVVGLYVKNLALFGTPSTSSWAGMNLAQEVFSSIPRDDRARRVARGELSRVSLAEPFRELDAYRGLVQFSRPTGIPVLDETSLPAATPNYNNKSYVRISNLYLRDSLRLIRYEPVAYLRSIKTSLNATFVPTTAYQQGGNAGKIHSYIRVFDDAAYVRTPYFGDIGLGILGAYLLSVLYGATLLGRWISGRGRSDPRLVTLLFLWFTVVYLMVILALAQVTENHRIRFEIDAFAAVLSACALAEGWRALGRRSQRG